MFRRFLEGADERLPLLAETKTNPSVHTVGMELNLNGLHNDAIHVSCFSGMDGGFVKLNAVSQVNARSTQCHIPEDDILHSHHCENSNYMIYPDQTETCLQQKNVLAP
jgi:hypothetical protein